MIYDEIARSFRARPGSASGSLSLPAESVSRPRTLPPVFVIDHHAPADGA
ncbi:MAG: hypothetical protein NZ561_00955 [Phycisphaerae bacterium]|nr:hypothetical protein [Phycisphaerae bacterium]